MLRDQVPEAGLEKGVPCREEPDSTRNPSQAFSRWAFFNPGPVELLPAGDRPFIALLGSARWTLAAPSQLPQNSPGLWQGIMDMTHFPNNLRDPFQRPKVGSKTPGLCTPKKRGLHSLKGRRLQAGFAPRPTSSFEPSSPLLSPGLVPAAGCLATDVQPACHFRLPMALGKQSSSSRSASFQGREVSPWPLYVSHADIVSNLKGNVTVL